MTTEAPTTPENRILSTLNEDGSRRWLRPKLAKGRYLLARRLVAYALIGVFTVTPYIEIGGKPAILLDIGQRKFTFFGTTFLPTDTLLVALLGVGIFLTIFSMTALFGRVWCGWACPQTVYMEFLFRPLERLFEGTPGRRKKSWQGTPPARIAKYLIYFACAIYLAHTFLAYFIGIDRLATWVTRSPLEHPIPFLVMVATTGLMLFDFGFFREQLCIVACPYGRFQSVLLDRHSLIVSYDFNRGEPRGKAKRKKAGEDVELPVVGDCVDCKLCSQVCPTGIDIRDGLQMECVNCTQCIDACDSVMDKLNRPRGLIRYSSQAVIEGASKRIIRPRLIIYPTLLAGVATLFVYVLVTKAPADIKVLRGPGNPFTMMEGGRVANQLQLKITNRTESPATYVLTLPTVADSEIRIDGVEHSSMLTVQPGEMITVPAIVFVPDSIFEFGRHEATFEVSTEGYTKKVPFKLQGPYQTGGSS